MPDATVLANAACESVESAGWVISCLNALSATMLVDTRLYP